MDGAAREAVPGPASVWRPRAARLRACLGLHSSSYRASHVAAIEIPPTAATTSEIRMATAHPMRRPSLRCLPDLVRGMPVIREILPLRADSPVARRHDHEKPNFLKRLTLLLYTPSSAEP
jgi:hypothetical protein